MLNKNLNGKMVFCKDFPSNIFAFRSWQKYINSSAYILLIKKKTKPLEMRNTLQKRRIEKRHFNTTVLGDSEKRFS